MIPGAASLEAAFHRPRYARAMSHSAFGTLGRKLVAWAVLALVAVVLLKLAVGIVAGLVMTVLTIALLVVAGFAVLWAVRRL
jgi:hypothetical protein